MPYKQEKEPKKPIGKIVLMILLILLSLTIVAIVYLVKGGVIVLPQDDKSSSVAPSSQAESEKPQPPPELVMKDDGTYNKSKVDELKKILKKHEFSVSVYYFDLTNGKEICFNEGKKYAAGSVVKAPYCKWLISSGQDLNATIALSESNIAQGGGELKKSPIGTAFTVQKLIDEALINSDNTAYNMLAQQFGFDGFLAYAKELGVYANQSKENIFGSMSAAGAGIYFADIYKFAVNSPEKAEQMILDMKTASYNRLISEAISDKEVAHKFGFNNGSGGFHDAAIVYDEHPYILTIFTTLNPDNNGTIEYIQSIAKCIDSMR